MNYTDLWQAVYPEQSFFLSPSHIRITERVFQSGEYFFLFLLKWKRYSAQQNHILNARKFSETAPHNSVLLQTALFQKVFESHNMRQFQEVYNEVDTILLPQSLHE